VPKLPRILFVAAFIVASLTAFGGSAPQLGVLVEPSKTWVGMARVHLEVGELWLSGNELAGAYQIRVPLLPSRSDVGTLRLQLSDSVEQLRGVGGTLVGSARSSRTHNQNDVVATVTGDGRIRIDVYMKDRVLSFKSRYATFSGRTAEAFGDS